LLRPLASMMEEAVETSGTLCRITARKMIQPSQPEIKKPEAIAMPSKNVWITRPKKHGITAPPFWQILPRASLSPKWKMASDSVFEEVHQEITHQDQNGRFGAGQGNAFR